MNGWGQQPETLSQAGRSDLSSRSGQALNALAVAAEAHGGYDRIPGHSADLQFAYDTAMANNKAIRGLATDGEAGFGFADPFTIAGAGDSWKGQFQSALRQGARDLAISGGVVTGMLQGVGDSVIGAGALLKDLLLAQQYMFGGGDNAVNRFLPGFDARQEAYQNVRALGATVGEIVSDPQRYLGDVVGRSFDKVTTALSTAQRTDDLNDWFFYGAAMGNVTLGVASTVAGAAGAARLATSGAGELNLLLRSRIDALAPDVRGNPFAPELSRGAPGLGSVAVSGETAATAGGKSVHARRADQRRAEGSFDLVNEQIMDANGLPVMVSRRVDLKTGLTIPESGLQVIRPDAVDYGLRLIVDDKPFGRPIAKDQQEILRYIRGYEAGQGVSPRTIAIERYDRVTGQPVVTELYQPTDFPLKRK